MHLEFGSDFGQTGVLSFFEKNALPYKQKKCGEQ